MGPVFPRAGTRSRRGQSPLIFGICQLAKLTRVSLVRAFPTLLCLLRRSLPLHSKVETRPPDVSYVPQLRDLSSTQLKFSRRCSPWSPRSGSSRKVIAHCSSCGPDPLSPQEDPSRGSLVARGRRVACYLCSSASHAVPVCCTRFRLFRTTSKLHIYPAGPNAERPEQIIIVHPPVHAMEAAPDHDRAPDNCYGRSEQSPSRDVLSDA